MINLQLAEKQGLNMKSVYYIGVLHERCKNIEKQMSKYEPESEEFQDLLELWTMTQFDLQELWKFDRNPSRHPTWTLPHCTCPNMDNADAGTHMYFTTDCPIHNEEVKNETR